MEPTDGGYVFLGFRRQSNGDHYAFVVDPDDGTYRLLGHLPRGTSTTLIGRTRSPAIRAGTETNRLGVQVQDSVIVLTINGLVVGRARDEEWRQGSLTLGVGSRTDATMEGRFSSLLVTAAE